jgi:hypothetical protein
MQTQGLSLDQAPPFHTVYRFYLIAPLFVIAAAILLLVIDSNLLTSYLSPSVVAIVHLLTLGFFLNTIFGSLAQMLPVLAGVSLDNPERVTGVVFLTLNVGIVTFVAGLILTSNLVIAIGSALLFISALIFLVAIARLLFSPITSSATIVGFRVATGAALVGVSVGALLGLNYTQLFNLLSRFDLLHLHYDLMIYGTICTLIIAVCYKVIPMFYVAAEYPPWAKKFLVPLITLILIVESLNVPFTIPALSWFSTLLPLIYFLPLSIFALITIYRLYGRRRPMGDTTVYYWYLGMTSLIASGVIMLIHYISYQSTTSQYLAVVLGIGAILSIMLGMLYKIVPFLAWFHLTAQGVLRAPTMRALLPTKVTNLQFMIHLSGVLLLIGGVTLPTLTTVGSVVMIVSQLAHLLIITQIVRRYYQLKN